MDNNIAEQDSITFSSKRSIFYKLADNENGFTQLLCNMTRFKEFENILLDFFGINNNNMTFITQFGTGKHGIFDLVIKNEDEFNIIEAKIRDSDLTPNQPAGYVNELLIREEKSRKLFFLIPRNYNHEPRLENRIKKVNDKVKNSKITIEIKYWEEFFERCKKKNIYKKNVILYEYYNLLKSKFGYETLVFYKEEQNIMKENVKNMYKYGKLLYDVFLSLPNKGFKVDDDENGFDQIGMDIYNNNKKVRYGWFGIWFPLSKEKDDVFVFVITNNDEKIFNNFLKKYRDKCKTFEYDDPNDNDKNKDTEFKYICIDDYIFDKDEDSNSISDKITKELLEIIKNIKSRK